MPGLKPSGVARLAIEVKAAVPTHTAVVGAGAFKGRFRRPSKRALLSGEERKFQDDLVHRKKALTNSRRAGGSFMIRSCMIIGHGTDTTGGNTTFELPACSADRQEKTTRILRKQGR
jgi:hypothetical protein